MLKKIQIAKVVLYVALSMLYLLPALDFTNWLNLVLFSLNTLAYVGSLNYIGYNNGLVSDNSASNTATKKKRFKLLSKCFLIILLGSAFKVAIQFSKFSFGEYFLLFILGYLQSIFIFCSYSISFTIGRSKQN